MRLRIEAPGSSWRSLGRACLGRFTAFFKAPGRSEWSRLCGRPSPCGAGGWHRGQTLRTQNLSKRADLHAPLHKRKYLHVCSSNLKISWERSRRADDFLDSSDRLPRHERRRSIPADVVVCEAFSLLDGLARPTPRILGNLISWTGRLWGAAVVARIRRSLARIGAHRDRHQTTPIIHTDGLPSPGRISLERRDHHVRKRHHGALASRRGHVRVLAESQ